jgi:hypothetical protein
VRKKVSLADQTKALLDPRVQAELAESIPGFDRQGFLTSVLDVWGGQDALARDMHEVFAQAPKGSMVRQRILELIVRMIGQHTDSTQAMPVEDMDDESLRRAILAIAGEAGAKVGVLNADAS